MIDRPPHRRPFRLNRSLFLASLWTAAVLACVATVASRTQASGPAVFINEIHYDNTGTDAGEFIEIAGPAGTSLAGYSIVLYNGTGGAAYDTDALSGAIPDQQSGFGTVSLSYPVNGIQNGAPDGVALVFGGAVVQFLSYEGTFVATGGPALGMTSTDIGVTENGLEPLGLSVQLKGTGTLYDDFTWSTPTAASPGAINTGQTFGSTPPTPSLSINDVSVTEGNSGLQTATFTVSLTSAAGPAGVSFQIDTADGSASAGSDYQALSAAATIAAGNSNLTFAVQVAGDTAVEPDETFEVRITNVSGANVMDATGQGTIVNDDATPSPSTEVVINEIDSDTPGTDAAEFIELYDGGAGNTPLTGLTVVLYNGSNDLSYAAFDLTGRTTNASGYFVLGNAAVPGVDLVFPGNVLQNGADAVALYRVATFAVNAPVTLSDLQDAVVYDTSDADDTQLLALLNAGQPQVDENAAGGGTINSIQRCPNGGGGQRNTAGFLTLAPTPGAASFPCPGDPPPATPRTISEIQGATDTSPFAGTGVITIGVATGVKSNGFFMQSASPDADPATSEGIFVFTGSAPMVADSGAMRRVAIGDSLEVTGEVVEFRRSSDTRPETLTEISGTPVLVLLGSGQALPAALDASAIFVPAADRVAQLEPYESMLVTAGTLQTVAPTNGFGEFFAVIDPTPRPFREPGITAGHALPFDAPSPNNIPRFDGNLERVMIEADEQTDASGVRRTPLHVATGASVTGVFGPLDYAFDEYRIQVDAAATLAAAGGIEASAPAPAAANHQFAIGSANLLNFINPSPDRVAKAALMVREVLRTPAILGAIEVGDVNALQQLGDAVNAAAGTSYQPVLLDADENSANEQNIGFLIDTARVDITEGPTQLFKGKTFDFAGVTALLHDRPPLVVKVSIRRPGSSQTFPVTLMLLHLRSLLDIDSEAPIGGGQTTGARVREKRRLAAEDVADAIEERQGQNVVVLGDFNAFQFNDGYGDIVGTLRGNPAPADQVVESSVDRWDHELIDLIESLPEDQRYSYSFGGSAQVLDHILVNGPMLARLNGLHYARTNADFPSALGTDFSRPERLSDHDPVLAIFDLPALPTTLALASSANPSLYGQPVTFTATVSADGSLAGGSVEFADGATVLATTTVDANGEASFTTSTLGAGSHVMTARFSGAGFQPSEATVVQTVQPGAFINDVAVVEGNEPGTVTAVFAVTLSTPSPEPVTVDFATSSIAGGAAAGIDYNPGAGTVTFPPGVTTQPIAVAIVSELTFERDEIYLVTLSAASGAILVDAEGVGTILNDDPQPTLSIGDATIVEPSSGDVDAAFAVTLSAPAGVTVIVNFSTEDGTAHADHDYTTVTGTLIFPEGSTTQTITVPVGADGVTEPVEAFTVRLLTPTNAGILDGIGTGIIVDGLAPYISGFTPASGERGAIVTISGVNFTGATSVRFGGIPAAFTVISSTSIEATVPVAAQSGPITVRTIHGAAASATPFLIAPSITTFAPPFGSVGTVVTIVGANLDGATSVHFGGGAAATILSVTSTVVKVTVPNGAATGPISLTTPGGTVISPSAFTVKP